MMAKQADFDVSKIKGLIPEEVFCFLLGLKKDIEKLCVNNSLNCLDQKYGLAFVEFLVTDVDLDGKKISLTLLSGEKAEIAEEGSGYWVKSTNIDMITPVIFKMAVSFEWGA